MFCLQQGSKGNASGVGDLRYLVGDMRGGTLGCPRVHGCTPTPAQSYGGAAWGYVSCRNALSESGSLVTASTLKRGEDALNPFTMQ